jgi:hypothetical protein
MRLLNNLERLNVGRFGEKHRAERVKVVSKYLVNGPAGQEMVASFPQINTDEARRQRFSTHPSYTAWFFPPTSSCFSKIIVSRPFPSRTLAAESPAGPAPMMHTGLFGGFGGGGS